VDCSGDGCNMGACNPADGTCSDVPVADDTVCDSDACDMDQVCTAGVCGGGSSIDCSAEDVDDCNVGVCNPADGTCAAAVVADGISCTGTMACMSGETCTAGMCGGGTPLAIGIGLQYYSVADAALRFVE
jgi:hypothetical protein